MRRKIEDFHDGAKDGLTPLAPLDINELRISTSCSPP